MIDEPHLQRFKGHRDTIVRLGRMTLLVGPNGSGKTSALEALDTLGRAAAGSFPWQDPRPRYEAHVHRGDREADRETNALRPSSPLPRLPVVIPTS